MVNPDHKLTKHDGKLGWSQRRRFVLYVRCVERTTKTALSCLVLFDGGVHHRRVLSSLLRPQRLHSLVQDVRVHLSSSSSSSSSGRVVGGGGTGHEHASLFRFAFGVNVNACRRQPTSATKMRGERRTRGATAAAAKHRGGGPLLVGHQRCRH